MYVCYFFACYRQMHLTMEPTSQNKTKLLSLSALPKLVPGCQMARKITKGTDANAFHQPIEYAMAMIQLQIEDYQNV